MREIVPRQFERVGLVARCDERQLGIALERAHDIAQLAIDARRQRRLGKAGSDIGGDLCRSGTCGHIAHGAVGKRDLDHFCHAAR